MGTVTRKSNYTPVVKFRTKPFKHQRQCLAGYGMREFFALLAEPGTGKTWIIINNIAELWTKHVCDAALVFAPNGIQGMWTRLQLPEHMPASVKYESVAWYAQQDKKDREALARIMKPNPGTLRILTMNWEALQHQKSFFAAYQFARSAKNLVIVADESHCIKNPKTKRWKSLMKIRPFSRWRRIMTGTPIDGKPYSAFGQYVFLDEAILGTTSYTAFKAEYAEMLHMNHPLVQRIIEKNALRFVPQIEARDPVTNQPKYRNLDKLARLIAPHSFRVLKRECLDLPPKLPPKVLFCKMTKQQAAIYKRAEKEYRLEYEGELTPMNKLAIATKLSQITSGYYLHPLAQEPVRIPGENPKMDLLLEHVEYVLDMGKKLIIWARYTIQIEDILRALREKFGKDSCVAYYGDVKRKERDAAIESFERGPVPIFVGNQQAGGIGITLVAASWMFYFSNNWSLIDRIQSEDRADRIGQTESLQCVDFVAENTVDESMVTGVALKQDVANVILDPKFRVF